MHMRRRVLLWSAFVSGFALLPVPRADAGGADCHGPATEGAGVIVEMRDACFTPTVLRVDEGATVTFVNRDDYQHAVVGVGWGSYQMSGGDELAHQFPDAGTYPYACFLHPSMTGAVVVGDGVGSGASDVPVTEPVAARAPAPVEASSSSGALALAVGAGGLALGLGVGAVGGRRRRRQ